MAISKVGRATDLSLLIPKVKRPHLYRCLLQPNQGGCRSWALLHGCRRDAGRTKPEARAHCRAAGAACTWATCAWWSPQTPPKHRQPPGGWGKSKPGRCPHHKGRASSDRAAWKRAERCFIACQFLQLFRQAKPFIVPIRQQKS